MTRQELKLAQREVYNAGRTLCSVGLRLDGSKFYAHYRKMYDALIKLNKMLIKEINQ